MPELPDIIAYVESLEARIVQKRLDQLKLHSAFVLRSFQPPIEAINGLPVSGVRRLGKRIVLAFEDDLFLVLHLMIAGRLRWREPGEKAGISSKLLLAVFEFENGRLLFTEAGTKKRASMTLVRGESALEALNPGGIEPLEATFDVFLEAITRENHTIKRTLTDPHLLSGIGNAYSDEILHAARLSPLKMSQSLSADEARRLYDAVRHTLQLWIDRFREKARAHFPEKVTAFPEGMAVHGRFKAPCPVCGAPVQRIVYADNECNYCARCQTGGRVLADRSMSRLLKDDFPRKLKDV